MFTNIKTHVVGLQFVELTESVTRELQMNAPLRLMHLPQNPYDRNAIGVYVGTFRIGYIRRRHAKVFVRALTNSAWTVTVTNDDPALITRNSKSFPVTVRVEARQSPVSAAPKIQPSDAGGIYRLYLMKSGQAYIGQANHINSRLAEHWHDMALGIHVNFKLQEYWIQYGPSLIEAQLVDLIPPGLTAIQRQDWLGQRESEWIDRERARGSCVNLRDGGVHKLATPINVQASVEGNLRQPQEQNAQWPVELIETSRQAALSARKQARIEAEEAEFLTQLEEAFDTRHGMGPGSPKRRKNELPEEIGKIESDLEFLSYWGDTLAARVNELSSKVMATKGLRRLFINRLSPQQISELKGRLAKARQELAATRQEHEDKAARLIDLRIELDVLIGKDNSGH